MKNLFKPEILQTFRHKMILLVCALECNKMLCSTLQNISEWYLCLFIAVECSSNTITVVVEKHRKKHRQHLCYDDVKRVSSYTFIVFSCFSVKVFFFYSKSVKYKRTQQELPQNLKCGPVATNGMSFTQNYFQVSFSIYLYPIQTLS